MLSKDEKQEGQLGGPYVSLKVIAEELGVSRLTIRRQMEKAGIKPYFFSSGINGSIRYRLEEVRAWIATRQIELSS